MAVYLPKSLGVANTPSCPPPKCSPDYYSNFIVFSTSPPIGYSAILTMGSDGFVSVYSLPDLKLIYKEDCVDASDAIGQRNFTMARNGTLLHQRSPSEFTRGSMTEDARLEFRFSLPSKHISPLMLTPNTPKSMNGEPIFEVTHVSSTNVHLRLKLRMIFLLV